MKCNNSRNSARNARLALLAYKMLSSMQSCMTSSCVAEQQEEAYLILDAALISFMAALTR